MGPSSGSYIVAANPRGLHRANQPTLMSSDSNETDETSAIGRSATHRSASSGETGMMMKSVWRCSQGNEQIKEG